MIRSILLFATITMMACHITKRTPANDDSKKLEMVIDVPGKNASELYTAVNEWMVLTFIDAESVIQFQDKQAGKVMGKYVGSYQKSKKNYIPFKSIISIDIKDEKTRITFLDPQWKSPIELGGHWNEVQFIDTIEKIQSEWQSLVISLETHLVKKSDW